MCVIVFVRNIVMFYRRLVIISMSFCHLQNQKQEPFRGETSLICFVSYKCTGKLINLMVCDSSMEASLNGSSSVQVSCGAEFLFTSDIVALSGVHKLEYHWRQTWKAFGD